MALLDAVLGGQHAIRWLLALRRSCLRWDMARIWSLPRVRSSGHFLLIVVWDIAFTEGFSGGMRFSRMRHRLCVRGGAC